MKAGDWLLLIGGIAAVALALFVAGVLPAHAQAACADPILAFTPPAGQEPPAITYLGRDTRGLPVFLATAPDGSWRIFVMRAPELVCVILAGREAPCPWPGPHGRCRDPPAR